MKTSCLPGSAVISVLFAIIFTPFDVSLGLSFLGFTLLLACLVVDAAGSTGKLCEHFRTRQFALRVFAYPSGGRVIRLRQTLCQLSIGNVERPISPTNGAKGPVHSLLHEVAFIERALLDERQQR